MSVIPMLKVTVMTHLDDVEAVVETLQEAGVVHLTPLGEGEGVRLRGGDDDEVETYQTLNRLAGVLGSVAPAPVRLQTLDQRLRDVIAKIQELEQKRGDLEAERVVVDDEIRTLKPWGSFSMEAVKDLVADGVPITFANITREQWNLIDQRNHAFAVMHETEQIIWVVFFGTAPALTPVELPERDLDTLEADRERIAAEIRAVNRDLGCYSQYGPMLRARAESLKDRVALLTSLDGAHVDAPVTALRGFVPAGDNIKVQDALREFPVTLLLEQPDADDDVPVMLSNNWFFKGFEAVLKTFSGISYREKDVTWMVGLLFIIFGSLCLLDAGYGLMLMVTGMVLYGRGQKPFGRVFALTGFFSIPIGLASGQAFGLIIGKDLLMDQKPLVPLATDPLSAFNFSLTVGAAAMAFSYGIALWQRGLRNHALGNLLMVVAGGMIAAGSLAPQGSALGWLARIGPWVIAPAVLAWLCFPEPVFGTKARVPNIIWTFYSGVTGLIQDILSHMRLFGIALSGSILAMVVNQIAAGFPLLITIPFAVIGHIFVYALALLSLYIHANRLIFLEVGSKCIDGGRHYYEPLQRGAS